MENEEIILEENNNILIENISINIDIEKYFSYASYHTDARLKIETYTKNTSYSFIHSLNMSSQQDIFGYNVQYANDIVFTEMRTIGYYILHMINHNFQLQFNKQDI